MKVADKGASSSILETKLAVLCYLWVEWWGERQAWDIAKALTLGLNEIESEDAQYNKTNLLRSSQNHCVALHRGLRTAKQSRSGVETAMLCFG